MFTWLFVLCVTSCITLSLLRSGRYKSGWPQEPNKYGQPGYARNEVPHERVGRAIRTGWVLPETLITVSTFPTSDSVVRFYRDSKYTVSNYEMPETVCILNQPNS